MRTLGTDEVTESNLADDAVSVDKIVAGSIPHSKMRSDSAIPASKLAGTLDLSGKTVTLPAASVTAHVTATDTSVIENNIAMLAFKLATADSLNKYQIQDQVIDEFIDTSGITAGDSTNALHDTAGDKSYSGSSGTTNHYEIFTSTPGGGTWTAPGGITTAEILVVGGGGSGGSFYHGGGGGGGGIVHATGVALTGGTSYTVTVGTGANGPTGQQTTGAVGADSVWNAWTAKGGGGGGSKQRSPTAGGNGGGGGGGQSASAGGSSTQASFSGTTTYGFSGCSGHTGSPRYGGGGGGGAGNNCYAGGASAGGSGANGGSAFSTFAAYGSDSEGDGAGSAVGGFFAGGGGGSVTGSGSIGGGRSGGGDGGNGTHGQDARDGTGSGGGGGGHQNGANGSGGDGGDGFVGLYYSKTVYVDMTLVSTTTTAEATPTKGDIVFLLEDAAGTNTITASGDVRAYISRDAGSNWSSAVTLADEGDWGTNKRIITARDVDISSLAGTTSLRWKITTHNQSASKVAAIHAVSLGWS